MINIKMRCEQVMKEIPDYVKLVAATKSRTVDEIKKAIDAGIKVIGENYVQEAEEKYAEIGNSVEWHLIGHLQKNKINKALPIFDVIQTVESIRKSKHIDKRVQKAGKKLVPVYIEINSGNEDAKYGISPEYESVKKLACAIAEMEDMILEGLIRMGAYVDYSQKTRG